MATVEPSAGGGTSGSNRWEKAVYGVLAAASHCQGSSALMVGRGVGKAWVSVIAYPPESDARHGRACRQNIHVKHEIDHLDGRFTRVNRGRLCAILALEAGSAVSYGSGDAKKRIF